MFTEATLLTLPSDPGFGHAPQSSIPTAAKRLIFAGVFIAAGLFAAVVANAADKLRVVSGSPAALAYPAYWESTRPEIVVCSVTSGVCAVRDEIKAKPKVWTAPDWMRPLPPLPPLPERAEYQPPVLNAEDFSEAQMLAVMSMSHVTRHQAIWHALRLSHEVPPFTLSTFIDLRDRGLAFKPEGLRFHALTTKADRLADQIAVHLQRKHDVHQSYMGSRIGPSTTLHCTCGWGCGLRRGDHIAKQATFAMGRHITSVKTARELETALAPRNAGAG
jgi:hypothetical protein